jgi:hypothetical protein
MMRTTFFVPSGNSSCSGDSRVFSWFGTFVEREDYRMYAWFCNGSGECTTQSPIVRAEVVITNVTAQ